MIYDNMSLPENTLPLDNIISAQNPRSMQNAPQSGMVSPNMMPHNMNTMLAAQENRSSTNNKSQAKQQLAHYCFALHEAVLYLDTHPNDQNALEYYRRKQQQLIQASENYQKVVGPIRSCMVDTNSGSWQWVETPWPWEIEED
ncbi:spore coat protein CotJB [Oscillospiraceae bacterium LTW-04]|nr:spore coat protein CotJB [Oscillospiraceae bacterium MB24-C1]